MDKDEWLQLLLIAKIVVGILIAVTIVAVISYMRWLQRRADRDVRQTLVGSNDREEAERRAVEARDRFRSVTGMSLAAGLIAASSYWIFSVGGL